MRTKYLARLSLVAVLLLTGAVPAMAQGDYTETHTYDMYYPKRAKGYQPLPFDVGDIDNINLYNGNLTLSLPLGPPLVAAADLQWQLSLHYSSKAWSRDKRDTKLDFDWGPVDTCWTHEGKGYFTGDPYIGLGWTLKLPHVSLHRKQLYDGVGNCTNPLTDPDNCAEFHLGSVVTGDGARHQLRRCLDGWKCNDSDNQWYSSNGSGWRVTWYDNDASGEFSYTDHLIGEHNGLRYYFGFRVLLDPNNPSTEPESIHRLVDTDFQSEARGWYCNRIESVRWSTGTAGSAYPAIVIGYSQDPRTHAPRPVRIESYYSSTVSTGKIQLDLTGGATDTVGFFDENGQEYLRYNLQNIDADPFSLLDPPDTTGSTNCICCTWGEPGCQWADSCEDRGLPLRYTTDFHYLGAIELVDPLFPFTPILEWGFDYVTTDCEYPDPANPQPDCIWAREDEMKGVLNAIHLPNGARIEYEYGLWMFAYQKLMDGRNFIGTPLNRDETEVNRDPPMVDRLIDDWTVGVRDRKVIDPARLGQPNEMLLEWTEYFRTTTEFSYSDMFFFMISRYGMPFDFSNNTSRPLVQLAADYPERFYTGFNQTVTRRHLIVDDSPPQWSDESANIAALAAQGLSVDVPSARFDDTIYMFSNGRCIFDTDDDGIVDRRVGGDHLGMLPIDGRLLEVRHYRGNAETLNSSPPYDPSGFFTWWNSDAPDPERIDKTTYTLDPETSPGTIDHWSHCSEAYGDLSAYCSARSENTRTRQATAEDLYLDDQGQPASLFTGSESWYETDSSIPGNPSTGAYRFQWNNVLTRAVADFQSTPPEAGDWDVESRTQHNEDGVFFYWLTTLPAEGITTFAGDGSFTRTTYGYFRNRLTATTQHVSSTGNDGNDVTTGQSYWGLGYASNVHDYGRIRTIELAKDGYTEDATGFEYDHQAVSKKWKLCAEPTEQRGEGRGTVERCLGWTDGTSLFSGTEELMLQQTINPRWRRPTSVLDGNGDGVGYLDFDILGRVTELEPTDSNKAPTWITYPNLRTTEIAIHDPDAPATPDGNPNLVARYEFDGLRRISHTARRREGTTPDDAFTAPGDTDFRHKTFFYDGVGTAWLESHWLKGADILWVPPATMSSHSNAELTVRVDPFGRLEKTTTSDGGHQLNTHRGRAYKLTTLATSGASFTPLSEAVLLRDARGNTLQVWEDKSVPASVTDPPAFPTTAQLNNRNRFINTTYLYDVANRLTTVTIDGLDDDLQQLSQTKSFVYNSLGNVTSTTLPEIGDGNGTITYQDFDARGKARRTVYPGEGGTIDSYDDAAGRFIERWAMYGTNWYQVGEAIYGTSAVANSIGKPVTETRYNIVISAPEYCPDGCIKSDSIGVTNDYVYGDAQGLLSTKTTTVSFGGEYGTGGSQDFATDYSYDLWANVSQITYPELVGLTGCETPPVIDFSFDAIGLETAKEEPQYLLSDLDYDDATGLLTLWKTPADEIDGGPVEMVRHTVIVDGTRPRPQLIGANHVGSDSSFFYSGNYTYDIAGNVTDIGPNWHYTYDDLGRITSATHGSARTYSYDDFGNLTSIGSATFDVDAATNRLDPMPPYAYDQLGNLIAEPQPSPDEWTRRHQFDLENHLVAAWATGAGAPDTQIAFAYDLAGERVLRYRIDASTITEATFSIRDQVGNVLTDFLWAPSGDWFRMADHLYMGRKPILRLSSNGSNRTYATLVADHLQSTRAEVTDAGTGAQTTTSYWPFGEVKQQIGTPVGKHLFTAHEREHTGTATDTLQNLDYMHARYYSFSHGRFLAVDPVPGDVGGSQSWNRYTYVLNNPIALTDPLGLYETNCGNDPVCLADAAAFEEQRQANLRSNSQQIRDAAAAYGDPGDANGIAVVFGDPGQGTDGNMRPDFDPSNWQQGMALMATVTIRSGLRGAILRAAVGHEGSHLVDAKAFTDSFTPGLTWWDISQNITVRETETTAFNVSHQVLTRENQTRNFGCDECDLGGTMPAAEVNRNIETILDTHYANRLNNRLFGNYPAPTP